MALIPRVLRPSLIIRRKALADGIFGPSTLWKAVAVLVFGRSTLKKVFGKNAELIEVAELKGPGHVMQIRTLPPSARRRGR
jgi:hypothetical protein